MIKKFIFALALLVVCGAAIYLLSFSFFKTKSFTNISINFLRNEDILWLATNKVVTNIVVEQELSTWALGSDKITVIAPVTMVYGMNLENLSTSNIETIRDGTKTVVKIKFPEIELLSFEVDFDEVKYIKQGNPLMLLYNRLINEDIRSLADKQLKSAAMAYAKDKNLIPDRQAVLRRIDKFFHSQIWPNIMETLQLVEFVFE